MRQHGGARRPSRPEGRQSGRYRRDGLRSPAAGAAGHCAGGARLRAGVTYGSSLEFGLRHGRFAAPSGIISTQNIEQTIQQLVSRSHRVSDFDALPIRNRAVASDMQRGEIVVPMGEIGSASFDKVAQAIPLGRAAALEQRARLERCALPEREYRAWRAAVSRPGDGRMRLAAVTITGAERVNERYVREVLQPEPRDVVSERPIPERAITDPAW